MSEITHLMGFKEQETKEMVERGYETHSMPSHVWDVLKDKTPEEVVTALNSRSADQKKIKALVEAGKLVLEQVSQPKGIRSTWPFTKLKEAIQQAGE